MFSSLPKIKIILLATLNLLTVYTFNLVKSKESNCLDGRIKSHSVTDSSSCYLGYGVGGGYGMQYDSYKRGTTPAPTTPPRYFYEPHSCPRMDVATWENEAVIYDNRNCAM